MFIQSPIGKKIHVAMVGALAIAGTALITSPQSAVAQEKPKCETFKSAVGSYTVNAKNTRWNVSLKKEARGDVFLWFSKSLISRDKYDMVESNLSLTKKIKEKEVLQENIGDELNLKLDFDNGKTFSIASPLERKTSRGKPFYYYRWDSVMEQSQHEAILIAAIASDFVDMSVIDVKSGAVLRRSNQSLDGLGAATAMAEKEIRRIDKAEPAGSCSRF